MKVEMQNGSLVVAVDEQETPIVKGIAQGLIIVFPGRRVLEVWQEQHEICLNEWKPADFPDVPIP